MHFKRKSSGRVRVSPAERRYESTQRAYWRDMYFVKKFGRSW